MKKLFLLGALLLMMGSAFAQQTLYRYYNAKQGKHYYTTDFNEYGNGRNGWYLDGPQCMVFSHPDRGLVPLMRYYNARNGDHYYTTNFNELRRGANGYVLEGNACFIAQDRGPGLIPLLSFVNRSTGEHFLTTIRDEMTQDYSGFDFIGIAGYVMPAGHGDHARFRGRDFYRDHH